MIVVIYLHKINDSLNDDDGDDR